MQRIVVRTPYPSLEDAVQHLAFAVAPNRITLLAGVAAARGEWVGFRVTLADDTSVLEGAAMCEELVDLGLEAPADSRYRVALCHLDLDPGNSLAHDRLVRARVGAGAPPSGLVPPPSALAPTPVSSPPSGLAPSGPSSGHPSTAPLQVFGRPSEPPRVDAHQVITRVGPPPPPKERRSRPSSLEDPTLFDNLPEYELHRAAEVRPSSRPPEDPELLLRISARALDRAEALVARLPDLPATRVRELPSPDAVLRYAMRIGLAVLEAQVTAEDEALLQRRLS